MSVIVKDLKEYDQEGFKSLKETCAYVFLKGQCYEFAIAVSRNTGWPMVGLIAHETIWHVAVRMPKKNFGEDYIDARGPFPEEIFGRPFRERRPYRLREVTEEELLAVRKSNGQIISAHSIRWAGLISQMVWPELEWKHGPKAQASAFLTELEALSRKYGLWVCAPYPTTQPFLSYGGGDEKGYSLTPSPTGLFYSMNREI